MRRRQDLRRSAVLRCQGQGRATVYREIEREHTHTAAGAADGYHAIAELRLIGNGGTPRRRTGGEPAGARSCLPTQIGRVNPNWPHWNPPPVMWPRIQWRGGRSSPLIWPRGCGAG